MASRIDALVDAYSRHVSLPWATNLSSAERVWFALYDKADERRLRYKVEAFQVATVSVHKHWVMVDLTDCFSRWIDPDPDREALLSTPAALERVLGEFLDHAAQEVTSIALEEEADEDTVIAVLGVASLFGFAHVSDLVPRVAPQIPGRLLVFFPGSRQGNSYRLLDAREGWNYLATPITAHDEGSTL